MPTQDQGHFGGAQGPQRFGAQRLGTFQGQIHKRTTGSGGPRQNGELRLGAASETTTAVYPAAGRQERSGGMRRDMRPQRLQSGGGIR